MQIKSLVVLAATSFSAVQATFAIVTETEKVQVPEFTSVSEATEWYSDISVEAAKFLEEDKDFLSKFSVAQEKMSQYVETATYSFDPEVTDSIDNIVYTTVPAWYASAPTEVKEYNEAFVSAYQRAVEGATSGSQSTKMVSFSAALVVAFGAGMLAL